MAAIAQRTSALSSSRAAAKVPATRRGAAVIAHAADRKLWAPSAVAPEYLNGTLAGDYGV
jgi:hypothetical protein